MKKFLVCLISALTICTCCFFAACIEREPVKADENTVVITATDSSFDFNEKTLKDYMDHLQQNGKLTYTISNGMVTSINGKSQTLTSYWMLYTDDSENADSEFGLEYEGTVYGSANWGAEALTVKEGCIYIWAYQTF